MYDENSALAQVIPAFIQIGPPNEPPSEINAGKIKMLLKKFHCFPFDQRKKLWSLILHLPNNIQECKRYREKPVLPQVREMCKNLSVGGLKIANALIHWHAPLINCEWLVSIVQKLDEAFPKSPTFVFEVIVTLYMNLHTEWLSEIPGPPPEVLSRIDSMLSMINSNLRDKLGTGLVAWPAYRSFFAETLYDRPWLELMDHIICSSPQFFEFCVVAWLDMNELPLQSDHETFNLTMRPAAITKLVKRAQQISKKVNASLHTGARFKPLTGEFYPMIEANSDAVVLRTLQTDQDRLADLQKQLIEERRAADEAEIIKLRKQQTYDSIAKLHSRKEEEDRIATAKAAADLDRQMKHIRLESVRLKQAEERQFLDQWMNEWNQKLDFNTRGLRGQLTSTQNTDEMMEECDARITAMMNLRQGDLMVRDARRISASRAKHARSELDVQAHQRALRAEVARLEGNPELLMAAPSFAKNSE